ncbi:hypothetical protein [Aurantiacibacter poecillastricola]|uniref:hypothetical protein n=1 Tax=Aurantiacibacter poecillastricola TaxID=3064385 RepID=UPI00273ECB75|nr:hypothetical protein [Aurantiacibacter sp. 219JJ12-13]MDP5262441.1 hypothetical protein [Aurantiacibacter sp. 219JJ12-13]
MKLEKLSTTGALFVALSLAACGGQEAEAPPLGTAQQMMAQEMQPTAEVFWESVGSASELIDGEPVFREWEPETDAEWNDVHAAAVRLGELGEILMTPAYAEGRGDDWMAYSQGLVDAAAQAQEAALAKDPEAVFETGGTIYSVCSACHRMYPPEVLPEGVTVDDVAQPRPNEDLSLEEYVEEADAD